MTINAEEYSAAAPVRRLMQDKAYADDRKLATRQAMWQYVEKPPPSARGRVLGAVDLTGDEFVVDVGCGNGMDLAALVRAGHRGPIVGVDLSTGMLRSIEAEGPWRVNGDVMAVPIRSDAADVVLAMHMLYHVADIPAAVRELRRVLKPDGVCVTSTNSTRTMPELMDVWQASLSEAAGVPVVLRRESTFRYSLENAPDFLAAQFSSVDVVPYDNRMRVPDARIVREYCDSAREAYLTQVPSPEAWDRGMDILEAKVAEAIARDGPFTITTAAGVLVSR
jgi:SAM-dependent methyltransferase